ncbi:RluA family pseudouridine synthase [Peribacillus glennii]|uniref:Pseudouridine synthase n=1 Tax=Peribacillus glennii TaxID=2303991 RepID=A0A372LDK0_9BACI|nr:RluA family pseudouridine synthase [Peribacillus glennii]RFU64112.1 RluA family pseudouridine synthase [Peribacillus glennii]
MPNEELKQAFKLHWVASERESGMILREFIRQRQISRRALAAIKFGGGLILVNEKEATVRYVLKGGDRIQVIFPPEEPSSGLVAEMIPLTIKYEDEFILVVAKPPFMSTIPSREHPAGSLANALAWYYRDKGLPSTIHVVTRLDRDTSGLVLVAKHSHVHHLLSEQQKQGLVKRKYIAIAEGYVEERSGKIEEPIGRKPTSIIEREVRADGQYACTLFEVTGRSSSYSLMSLQLLTGRTHQIRVHLSHYGFPLAGDDLYGGSTKDISRQALHCSNLKFFHPFLNKQMVFEEPLPEDMRKLLGKRG